MKTSIAMLLATSFLLLGCATVQAGPPNQCAGYNVDPFFIEYYQSRDGCDDDGGVTCVRVDGEGAYVNFRCPHVIIRP